MFTQRRRPGGKTFLQEIEISIEIINKPSSRQKHDDQYNADQRTFDGPRIRVAASDILTEITQDDARNDDYRRSSSQRSSHRTEQTKDMQIQN